MTSKKKYTHTGISDLISLIRSIREKRNITQTEIADKLNIEQSTYNKIETGKTELKVIHLLQILTILDMNPLDFFKELYNVHEDSSNDDKLEKQIRNHLIKYHELSILHLKTKL